MAENAIQSSKKARLKHMQERSEAGLESENPCARCVAKYSVYGTTEFEPCVFPDTDRVEFMYEYKDGEETKYFAKCKRCESNGGNCFEIFANAALRPAQAILASSIARKKGHEAREDELSAQNEVMRIRKYAVDLHNLMNRSPHKQIPQVEQFCAHSGKDRAEDTEIVFLVHEKETSLIKAMKLQFQELTDPEGDLVQLIDAKLAASADNSMQTISAKLAASEANSMQNNSAILEDLKGDLVQIIDAKLAASEANSMQSNSAMLADLKGDLVQIIDARHANFDARLTNLEAGLMNLDASFGTKLEPLREAVVANTNQARSGIIISPELAREYDQMIVNLDAIACGDSVYTEALKVQSATLKNFQAKLSLFFISAELAQMRVSTNALTETFAGVPSTSQFDQQAFRTHFAAIIQCGRALQAHVKSSNTKQVVQEMGIISMGLEILMEMWQDSNFDSF